MLKFAEIFEFSKENFRKIPILKEFEWFEWFEWFGPSPIEPFNSGPHERELLVDPEARARLPVPIRMDNEKVLVRQSDVPANRVIPIPALSRSELGLAKLGKLANFANFWWARSRLYQNEILQENMRLTAFFKLYKICILLHRCNLEI